jgi:hypothetical protein
MNKFLFIILVQLFACTTTKNNIIISSISIAFGNGGGFTGIETKYQLKRDGNIYKITSKDTTPVYIKQLELNQLNQIFKDAEELKSYEYFKPENMYQFIELNNNRIAWGFSTDNVNPKIISLYQQLNKLLK